MAQTLTGTTSKFNCLSEDLAKKKHDLSADTLKLGLVTSAQTLTVSGQSVYADITAELTTANGYTAGGITATSVTVNRSGAVTTLDFADVTWTASGALAFRQWFLYNDTAASKNLIAFGLCKNDNTDVSLISGETYTLNVNVSGLITIG